MHEERKYNALGEGGTTPQSLSSPNSSLSLPLSVSLFWPLSLLTSREMSLVTKPAAEDGSTGVVLVEDDGGGCLIVSAASINVVQKQFNRARENLGDEA